MNDPIDITSAHKAQGPAIAKCYTLADLVDDLVAEHAAADQALKEGRNLGPVVPFDRLRDELGGWWPAGIICMHAQPGAGKSAFCVQCGTLAQCPVVHLTCEMSAKTVLRRMIANATGEYLGKLGRGKISAETIRNLALELAGKYPHYGIIDAVTAPCPAELLETAVRKMRAHDDHVFVVVDSLHSLASGMNPEMDEYQAVSTAVNVLRTISADYNASVLAISERNRAGMAAGGMSAGASSRKIEYSCEALIQLDALGDCVVPGMQDATAVNLRFLKNRNGRAGVSIGYAFDGETQRFVEVGDPWPDDSGKRKNGKRNECDAVGEVLEMMNADTEVGDEITYDSI